MKNMKIGGARLVLPDGVYPDGEVWFSGGKIDRVLRSRAPGPSPEVEWDLNGDFLVPGLIDTHVHGAGGFDTMDGTTAALDAVRGALLREGTTAFLATTMSAAPGEILQVLSELRARFAANAGAGRAGENFCRAEDRATAGAEFLGVHLEGPFLSPNYKGAQAAEGIWPEDSVGAADFVRRIVHDYPGLVRILTLAPERPDARELIEACRDGGILPSAGHTSASYDKMLEAAGWGLARVTHAFNAMPGIHHREPGLLTASLMDDRISLELIADGVHIHPSILQLVLRLKADESVVLVSDGTRAVGMPDGEYELGGQRTFVQRGVARLADGTIAGSAFPLLQGLRVLRAAHYPVHLAVRAATLNPARMLGVDSRLGSLSVGKEATFLRLSSEFDLRQVWLRGEPVFD
ncbi:N-acetylglucosamine-6-phosphate deacetylase [Acididesulfobacillus acetoxydans]|uniref:N-acetylglucosamine-6-phosphate deacetylase n=1 Tax=Acididesulfobacillus acetoxydans TaxID=1561005 RepID=A0A8S0W901_9FIRM|nr:N-acetylglucosamine-6-phosphate deacetylase [Acididesulfobacillus acetoxydans]CAA7602239.1 N-acetylglucosamine-6-phosphate deacetylase [Acididesulfobacillus acetoxydans]CEJ07543.1 N-acetylglucosamine-6-phosphate deacetylase [Acididesulfobacillus acetoxydans]